MGPVAGDDHSSSPGIADGIKRPTRKLRTGRPLIRLRPHTRTSANSVSLFGLAPCGVLPAICLTADAVRSYRTFSPLPRHSARESATAGGIFSVPLVLQVTLTGRYPAHCPSEFGLSSHLRALRRSGGRSSGRLRQLSIVPHGPAEAGHYVLSGLTVDSGLTTVDCRLSTVDLSVRLLTDRVLLELLVQVAARRADDFGGLRDVPRVLAEFLHQPRALGRFLELAQRAGL